MSIYTAKWIRERSDCESPIFHKRFDALNIKKATLDICGLGFFEAFINGLPVTDAVFTPAQSNYCQLAERRFIYPFSDEFRSPRVYFCRFDITDLIKNGENLLSVHLGNGFFNQNTYHTSEGEFYNGYPRLIFSISLENDEGSTEINSDGSVTAGRSHIICNNIYEGECQDLSLLENFHSPEFDEKSFAPAMLADAPVGELTLYTYPYDKVIRKIVPKMIGSVGKKQIYDLGENISGRIVFSTSYDKKLIIEHSEKLSASGELEFTLLGGQPHIERLVCIGDGRHHTGLCSHFTWQGFRYFAVEGELEELVCEVIHTELKRTGDFHCDNAVINTVFDMYLRTQQNNIHGCIPSDCPHLERKGYTGDGQITAETVIHIFEARGLYKKWMQDIADCQNIKNGHIQYTAPFVGGGGGPGGWGGAAVVIPFTFYKMYGDAEFVHRYRDCAVNYLSYMETLCEAGIVTHAEPGQWCLGDWCYEGCRKGDGHNGEFAAFVNTAMLIKYYAQMLLLDEELSLGLERKKYENLIDLHTSALINRFFDSSTGDFLENFAAANVFALDIGLGDERTLSNLVDKYERLGGFDTGIFATEALIRILGDHGYDELVYKLLSSREQNRSFYSIYERGATTLWEYWHGQRSHSHPMFGGCLKALFTTFLGIEPLSAGYRKVKISPCDVEALGNMSGYITTPQGRIEVAISRDNGICIKIKVPKNTEVIFSFREIQRSLFAGTYEFIF